MTSPSGVNIYIICIWDMGHLSDTFLTPLILSRAPLFLYQKRRKCFLFLIIFHVFVTIKKICSQNFLFPTAAASLSRTITRAVSWLWGRGKAKGGWLIPVWRWRPEDGEAFILLSVNAKGWYWFPSSTIKTNVAFTFRVGALPLSLFKSICASKQPS